MSIQEDQGVVHIHDILSFQIDGLGFIATTSLNQPTSEREESITQLRVAITYNNDHLDYTRCAFRIESDSLQVKCYHLNFTYYLVFLRLSILLFFLPSLFFLTLLLFF